MITILSIVDFALIGLCLFFWVRWGRDIADFRRAHAEKEQWRTNYQRLLDRTRTDPEIKVESGDWHQRYRLSEEGHIWMEPDLKIQYGKAQLDPIDRDAAIRVGWREIGHDAMSGLCLVQRTYEEWHRQSQSA